jgi:alkanesulfonate monooxygenase SsuD/methylene tetrahydromethanopterin reductase-like flavin-dependent oxidoreductase (luciferase family)
MLRLGVCLLPDRSWPEAAPRWRRAEELGFHSAWVYDHLTWSGLPAGAWYGAIPTLAAAAGVTSRIRLGTLVSSPNFRHPVPFAQDVMSLDDLSAGRVDLGFGAGSINADATALGLGEPGVGWPARERGERFRESVELLDLLLRGAPEGRPHTTFHGRHYDAVDARMEPGCVQRPRVPFSLAAGGKLGMATVARFGSAWITTDWPGGDPAADDTEVYSYLRKSMTAMDAACEKEGRDPATLGRLLLTGFSVLPTMDSAASFADVAGRCEDLGFTDLVVHYPRESGPWATAPEVLEEIAASNC